MAEYRLRTPLSEEDVRRLRVGDVVYLGGVVYTARDQAHKRALKYIREGKELPVDFRGSAVYHCGPVVRRAGRGWIVYAAGPTTSARMETIEADFIAALGVRMIIGKGGMGERTSEALVKHGAVYGAFTGGAAALAAKGIKKVVDVKWLDLGPPEAIWVLEVEKFGPILVAMDSHGSSIYRDVQKRADEKFREIVSRLQAQVR